MHRAFNVVNVFYKNGLNSDTEVATGAVLIAILHDNENWMECAYLVRDLEVLKLEVLNVWRMMFP